MTGGIIEVDVSDSWYYRSGFVGQVVLSKWICWTGDTIEGDFLDKRGSFLAPCTWSACRNSSSLLVNTRSTDNTHAVSLSELAPCKLHEGPRYEGGMGCPTAPGAAPAERNCKYIVGKQ